MRMTVGARVGGDLETKLFMITIRGAIYSFCSIRGAFLENATYSLQRQWHMARFSPAAKALVSR
jgi:hypothetical protein